MRESEEREQESQTLLELCMCCVKMHLVNAACEKCLSVFASRASEEKKLESVLAGACLGASAASEEIFDPLVSMF